MCPLPGRLPMIARPFLFAVAFVTAMAQTPTAFHFLRTVVSPRSAALATATVALPGDIGTVLLNPAVISTTSARKLSSVFLKHVLDINAGAVLYGSMPLWGGRAALGAVYMDYGSFQRRDAQGQPLGEFSAHDLALQFWWGDTLEPRLFYGLAPKVLWERLESQNAWVVALDAGLLYLFPDLRTSVAIAVLHAGTALQRSVHSPLPLPTDLRLGLTHFLQGLPAVFHFAFLRLTDHSASFWQKFENFALGLEFHLSSAVHVRLGYDNQLRRAAPAGQRGATGVAVGVGIVTQRIQLDYSTTLLSAALLHRLGVEVGM